MKHTKRWGLESMYIKEILRLYYQMGRNRQQIANALGVSYSTVQRVVAISESSGEGSLLEVSESELGAIFYPNAPGRKVIETMAELDCSYLVSELKRRGVTRVLLYREYKDKNPTNAYSYSNFCQKIRDYNKQSQLAMVLIHEPGEKAFLDYCGDTVPIYDRKTKEVVYYAEIFVMTLAASGCTFFEAHKSQDQESFIAGIVRGFSYFGGVVKILVPDNLKAGVITNSKSDLRLSRAMMELADYYQIFVDPTRKYRAKDKAKVEERVGYIQRNVIAALRDQKFYSLDELNRTLTQMIDPVNQRPFSKRPGSRAELFKSEREYLSPLPLLPFSYGTWKTILVPPNYHIEIDHSSYSVPSGYRNKKVEVKLSERVVEIFFASEHIATHQRSYIPGTVVTEEAHLHPSHKAYLASLDKDVLLKKASEIGPATFEMGKAVFDAAAVGETGIKSLSRMLNLSKIYSPEELERACSYGISIGATSRHSIESILKTRIYEHQHNLEPPTFLHSNLRHGNILKVEENVNSSK